MKCPHCSANLASEADQCSQCAFSVGVVRAYLGAEWVRLERITDNQSLLSLKERRQLEVVLDGFERQFPQCFMAVYLGPLPDRLTTSDLGFWLINHGAFHTHQIAKRNDYGIALVIDSSREMASLVLGYALEPHFKEEEARQILMSIQKTMVRRQYGHAVESVVEKMARALKQVGKRVVPDSGSACVFVSDDLGLQPLRAAHRTSKGIHKA